MAGLVDGIDAQLARILAGWNLYSTLLSIAIVAYVAWIFVDSQRDADTHPLLLARQAQASPVRLAGESSVFRSPEVPHGYPLRTGLQVKQPGAPAYSAGKNGDIRHIWQRVTGDLPSDNKNAEVVQSRILTVFGKTEINEHNIQELSKEISVIGQNLHGVGARRVAVYLPNSIELLLIVFAGAFYGFTPILIPYNQPHARIIDLLQKSKVDRLVAAAGSLPLAEVSNKVPGLRSVIWIVEKSSRHMDWNEVPEGIGGKVDVSVWHDLVQDETKHTPGGLPLNNTPGNLIFLSQTSSGSDADLIEFTQSNIISAVAALISALPSSQRFNSSDLFLPADSFTHSYVLLLTLAALWCQSSLAINSVAGSGVELGLAAQSIAPTVVVASAETAVNFHNNASMSITSAPSKFAHYLQEQALKAGRMPATDSFLTRLNAPIKAALGVTPGKLRLLFISEKAGLHTPPLSSNDLSDLRIHTGARVIYALTAPKVAGAVAQTHVYDYRQGLGPKTKHSHFGIPLSSVEVKLIDTATLKTTDEEAKGEIVVMGPAVAGGCASLGITGTFREDHTLAYL